MAIILSIFLAAFCLNFFLVSPAEASPSKTTSKDTPAGRVWEGACGNPSMTWKQLLATNISNEVINMLGEHSNLWSSLEETRPRPFPWNMHIRTGEDFLPATIIRTKSDEEATDMAITTGETCLTVNKNSSPLQRITGNLNAQAVFGAHSKEDNGYLTLKIVACFVYPSGTRFANLVTRDDIGLIQFTKTPSFSDNLKPVCLPAADEPVPVGTAVVVPGWDQVSGKLVHAHLQVVNWDRCTWDFVWPEATESSYFCIDGFTNDTVAQWHSYSPFDTGASVLTDKNGTFVMLGMVTLSEAQSDGWLYKLPAVVARMSHRPYQDWIEKIVKTKSSLWKNTRWG